MKKLKFFLILFPIFFIAFKPEGYLNDFSGLLSQSQRENLEKRLIEIEKETTNEIAILIIKSLEGKSIEEYANEIFNEWKIGKKGKDNGVLILISLDDRKIRIEVGYGLESILTDSVCGRIIRDVMAPYFRKSDYYNGIKEAVETIYKITKGELVKEKKEDLPPIQFKLFWYFMCILFGFFTLGLLGLILETLTILTLSILAFSNRNTPLYAPYILFSLFIPFLFIFILMSISSFVKERLKRKLKKLYGRQWKNHAPLYLKGPFLYTDYYSHSGSGGFSGGFGGFGGGTSGGGGATGRW